MDNSFTFKVDQWKDIVGEMNDGAWSLKNDIAGLISGLRDDATITFEFLQDWEIAYVQEIVEHLQSVATRWIN